MAQKHNEQYINAPMTRLGTIGWPDQDRRVVRSSAFVATKWTAENPILQLGEVGYETDTNKLKIGDGVTKWNDLPYAGDGTGSLLPDQTGHSGEFLTTDGTDASWAAVDALPDQTGQSGKFLTTDGTDASWSDKPLVNNATAPLLSVATGNLSVASASNCAAYGADAKATKSRSVAVGQGASSNGTGTIVVGRAAVSSDNTILLNATEGVGLTILNDPHTMYVVINNGEYLKLLSADGTVPTARLTKVNTTATLAVADWSSSTQTVTVSGVKADSVVFVSPASASASDYASAGILCTAQAADSLTFTCTTTPSNAITVNVVCM